MKELQMQEVYKQGKRYEDISIEEDVPTDDAIFNATHAITEHIEELSYRLRETCVKHPEQRNEIGHMLFAINAFVRLVNEQQGVK